METDKKKYREKKIDRSEYRNEIPLHHRLFRYTADVF